MPHPRARGQVVKAGTGLAGNAREHSSTARVWRLDQAGDFDGTANAQAVFHWGKKHFAVSQHNGARNSGLRALELQVVTALTFNWQVNPQRIQQAARPGTGRDHHVVERGCANCDFWIFGSKRTLRWRCRCPPHLWSWFRL